MTEKTLRPSLRFYSHFTQSQKCLGRSAESRALNLQFIIEPKYWQEGLIQSVKFNYIANLITMKYSPGKCVLSNDLLAPLCFLKSGTEFKRMKDSFKVFSLDIYSWLVFGALNFQSLKYFWYSNYWNVQVYINKLNNVPGSYWCLLHRCYNIWAVIFCQ